MKRLLCIILCLGIVMLFTACGTDGSADEQDNAEEVAETQEPTEAPIEHPVHAAWFDDAVFVGDSITVMLEYYCENDPEALGKAQFYCAESLGYNNALWDLNDEYAVHPYYRGEQHLTENCAELTGATKVFIMLGMNDLETYGVDGTLDACKTLVKKILSHTPDVKIYLESVTPMLKSFEKTNLNNSVIDKFNVKLKEYCEKEKYKYLDINSIMRDKNGALTPEYCSDPEVMGIHFTTDACAKWADYLKNNV